MMEMFKKFLPKEAIKGRIGYYPVMSDEEWESIPVVYRAMEWFPIEVYNSDYKRKETAVVEFVEFDTWVEPYNVRATVKVHREDIPKILFRSYAKKDCQLYTICGVYFSNGVHVGAKWLQDSRTGAFGVYAYGHYVGKQGGFQGYVPSNIEETDDGFKYKGYVRREDCRGICHYCY